MVLFSESGEGGGAGYSVYLRKTDGSPAVRLGRGNAQALSPDGEWALAIVHPASDPQLVAYPTGAGEPKIFPKDGISVFSATCSLPDGKQILFNGSEARPRRAALPARLRRRQAASGHPGGVLGARRDIAGRKVAVDRGPDRKRYLFPLAGGEPKAIPGTRAGGRG